MKYPLFFISEEDWSLHRKGYQDHRRHQEKVKEAIRKNLADLISEESIVLPSGQKKVKIPIRSIEEYRFRFNHRKNNHVGQGNGDSQVGDVVAKDQQQQKGKKGKEKVGDQAGVEYYEAEVPLEELENVLFSELELPPLERKQKEQQVVDDIRFNDIRKTGLKGNIDKKRTLLSAIKRSAQKGKSKAQIQKKDLRFKTWEEVKIPHTNAVVIAMMDTSGSMGMFEKYVARSFFFWMTRFLRTKYQMVEIVFVAHHTEAKEVDEKSFFTKGESGGTICSSAYEKAVDIIDQRFSPQDYNIFSFHFSDGDNLTSDNDRCAKAIKELILRSNLFGYGEVNQYNRSSTLMNIFKKIQDPKCKNYVIKEKSQVYDALKFFFSK